MAAFAFKTFGPGTAFFHVSTNALWNGSMRQKLQNDRTASTSPSAGSLSCSFTWSSRLSRFVKVCFTRLLPNWARPSYQSVSKKESSTIDPSVNVTNSRFLFVFSVIRLNRKSGKLEASIISTSVGEFPNPENDDDANCGRRFSFDSGNWTAFAGRLFDCVNGCALWLCCKIFPLISCCCKLRDPTWNCPLTKFVFILGSCCGGISGCCCASARLILTLVGNCPFAKSGLIGWFTACKYRAIKNDPQRN